MFRVKNYSSFKDDVILDLRPAAFKDKKNHIIKNGEDEALKTLAIYGKNASGKSNLISALYFFESYIFNSFFDDVNEEKKSKKLPTLYMKRFLLANDENRESEFEMIFKHNDMLYQYGFILFDNDESIEIKEEWLFVDNVELYERKNYKEMSYNPKFKKTMEPIGKKIRNDRLFIGNLDYFVEEDNLVKKAIDGIKEYFRRYFNVNFELYIEGGVKGMFGNLSYSKRLVDDLEYRKKIAKFLKIADIGIEDLEITEDEKNGKKYYDVKTVHAIYDANQKLVETKEFGISMESSGTIRYLSFIQNIIDYIENGGTYIVDEITARLHPILTKFILDLYQSEDNLKGQLIFTTHDISFMNRDQMRRDEIVLIEKDLYGVSSIYSLADYGVRSDASFSKDYMAGKFGAIPVIKER